MSARAQTKKDQIISGLAEARKGIIDAVSSVPPNQQDEAFLGVWSTKDLLAHLVGWDYANVQAVQAILAGELPDYYSYYDRDWKTFNARLVAEYPRDDLADLLSLMEESHQALIGLLQSLPAEEFAEDRGVRFRRYKVTIAGILQVEIDDERTHHQQLEAFRDRGNS